MSSGLDDLERRGRWGRNATPPQPRPPQPRPPQPERTKATPKPRSKVAASRRPAGEALPEAASTGVERVVIYLSPEQTAWIRERQIEALRAGRRISTSKLIRALMDRAMS